MYHNKYHSTGNVILLVRYFEEEINIIKIKNIYNNISKCILNNKPLTWANQVRHMSNYFDLMYGNVNRNIFCLLYFFGIRHIILNIMIAIHYSHQIYWAFNKPRTYFIVSSLYISSLISNIHTCIGYAIAYLNFKYIKYIFDDTLQECSHKLSISKLDMNNTTVTFSSLNPMLEVRHDLSSIKTSVMFILI